MVTSVVQRGSIYSRCAHIVFALCAVANAATINAATPYRFDAPDQYLTRAGDYPRWAALWARHVAQTPAIDTCLADATQCPNYLKGYRAVIVGTKDLAPQRKMILVNRFINGRHWRIENGWHDNWRTLTDFLQSGGDCEDYAIAKYFALRQAGFAADDLRVGITWDFETNAYHAVTILRLDGQIHFLDVDGAPRRNQLSYRFLFSINENAVWDHVVHKTASYDHALYQQKTYQQKAEENDS